jgi:hypothetical protein
VDEYEPLHRGIISVSRTTLYSASRQEKACYKHADMLRLG